MCRLEERNMSFKATTKFCVFCTFFVDWNLSSNLFSKMLEIKGLNSKHEYYCVLNMLVYCQ